MQCYTRRPGIDMHAKIMLSPHPEPPTTRTQKAGKPQNPDHTVLNACTLSVLPVRGVAQVPEEGPLSGLTGCQAMWQ